MPVDTDTRRLIESHWQLANARRWEAFAALLHPSLRYEVPQTREYIEGGQGYLDMFRTWPGDWKADVKQLVCESSKAISVIEFAVDNQTMTGISVFAINSGLIVSVTDYWPEPYEPPPRLSAHMKRRPL
jgi:SnoaL-like domain